MIVIKVISDSLSIVKTVLNKQKIDISCYYRKSFFCREIIVDNNCLFYNTLTGKLILISEEEKNLIKNEQINYNNKLNQLIEDYFLVPYKFNEKDISDQLYRLNSLLAKEPYNKYVILPTTVCNARCYYCFEYGKKHYSMDHNTAAEVADYIVENSTSDNIFITWFGGEPLCNVDAINLICKKIKDSGKTLKSKMVTNGFLFNNDIITHATDFWNLENVQITLDGTAEVYNKIKAYVNCKTNAFNRVIENIDSLLKNNIKVRIRLNASMENVDDLFELCVYLSKKYAGNKSFSVYTAIVQNHDKNGKPFLDFDKETITKKVINLNTMIYDLNIGYRDKLNDKIKQKFCIADDDNCLVIHPNGLIGKCEFFLEDKIVGNIYDAKIEQSKCDLWKKFKKTRLECEKCLHYPICFELDECPICFVGCDSNDIKLKNDLLDKKIINTYNNFKNYNAD